MKPLTAETPAKSATCNGVGCRFVVCVHGMGGGKGMDLKTTEGGTQLSSGTLFQGMSAFFEDEQFFLSLFSATKEGSGIVVFL